jgi:hypothetical protein
VSSPSSSGCQAAKGMRCRRVVQMGVATPWVLVVALALPLPREDFYFSANSTYLNTGTLGERSTAATC